MRLQVNQSEIICVRAAKKFSAHPVLQVEKGEQYLVLTDPKDKWYDMGIPSSAKGYNNIFLKIWSKRVPAAKCFELCGTVGQSEENHFRIGAGDKIITVPESGEFYFFSNDNIHFYWNNWGQLEVKVTRLS